MIAMLRESSLPKGELRVFISALMITLTIALPSLVRAADPPPPPPLPSQSTAVGDTVTNPVTGAEVKVTSLLKDPVLDNTNFVRTDDGYVILVKRSVGNVIRIGDPPTALQVISTSSTSNEVQVRPASDASAPTSSLSYAPTYPEYQSMISSSGSDGDDPKTEVTSGDPNGVRYVKTGRGGRNGAAGALFVPPGNGGNGANGATITPSDFTNDTNVNTSTRIGVEVGSVGGKGGDGGDSILSFWEPGDGGNGGAGGRVTTVNNADVTTSGNKHYGFFVYSRSGNGGMAGDAIAALGTGSGGTSKTGGSVTATNNGEINTSGTDAYGIYGLSTGGSAGSGSGSWGIVGTGGSGSAGGDGGNVNITNNGEINTTGVRAHGIIAQSIGGTGGSSGPSGGIYATTGGSAGGGSGGDVSVTNSGSITTSGVDARGILAQSIGGGGGTASGTGGLVALGGSGGGGGSSGSVTVINSSSGSILTGAQLSVENIKNGALLDEDNPPTSGLRADGILAQSIGGSGGGGSGAGGLVAIGGSGSAAGDGGQVTVENYGSIETRNHNARGIVAQSIGGGGGDGGNTGGMVSLGGRGGGGGSSDQVIVKHGGRIQTYGKDASGIVAQSIGGGGGNGGSSGSVSAFAGVAIGGSGGNGGEGGTVELTLQGKGPDVPSSIVTSGDRSLGINAQSVGGGGGNGGGAVTATSGIGASVAVAIGGSGGSGGAGGTVKMIKGQHESFVETTGSDSTGIFLQSVGGGGGNGGYSVALADSYGPVSVSVPLSIGGSAGSGGIGGTVSAGAANGTGTITSYGMNGSILTEGDRSSGFVAQSVGGGGGNGGFSLSGGTSAGLAGGASVGVSLGGGGGGGGRGGSVTVATQGGITTKGDQSAGMLVQSVGGGGGNGGGSVSATFAAAGGIAANVGVTVGGSGGTGGRGGSVIAATRSGLIKTEGDQSTAVIVQSVGGGGGTGGFTANGNGSGAGIGAIAVSVGLGGSGGLGGDGGMVKADLENNASTTGEGSLGILVQSVGGGGGSGGITGSITGSGAGIGSGSVNVGIGGTGGSGGVGGAVTASSAGTIFTEGNNSTGLTVQSIGGGGGNGGFNLSGSGSGAGIGSGSVTVGFGGKGGTGNDAGVVTASSSGDVTTMGDRSFGVLAQSVGGGGGNGGFNLTANGSGAGIGSGGISVGFGGSGGAAGDGKNVTLDVKNNVFTEGESASGVIAQSIGGGGGNGGFNGNATGSGAGIGSGGIGFGMGGSGGAGGISGTVNAEVDGVILTEGSDASGFIAQSIGGGGGNGGFNLSASGSGAGIGSGGIAVGIGGSGGTGNDGGNVDADSSGTILTEGDRSYGILAQSVGGGGGNGGFNFTGTGSGAGIGSGSLSAGFGGSGGGAGDGKAVELDATTDVGTKGNFASGVVAQSIGGGGGNGGFNFNGSGSGAGIGSGTVNIGYGGTGAGGGTGGSVDSDYTGIILTEGDDAAGFIAQSIGGGGGNGGGNITIGGSGAGIGSGAFNFSMGGHAGAGGSAGTVVAATAGDGIRTFGDRSYGILAQSVGGGGGNGGFSASMSGTGAGIGSGTLGVSIGGFGGSAGHADTVDLTVVNDVYTGGNQSTAVIAQSIGGGGGNGGVSVALTGSGAGVGSGSVSFSLGGSGGAGGRAEDVTASVTGNITTIGDQSDGILAQSIGGGGGNGGISVTGNGSGAGVGSGGVVAGVGGFGGAGREGGAVDLTTNGDVNTSGKESRGVVAQSIGGGGGNGGLNFTATGSGAGVGSGAVSFGMGGFGGDGGSSGQVDSDVTGNITTVDDFSEAYIVQSIGGGGGNGAFTLNGSGSGAGTGSGQLTLSVGGSAGSGSDSNLVAGHYDGAMTTLGDNSTGMLVQAVGGGGGNGGGAIALGGSGAGVGSGAVNLGMGGFGGSAGHGGLATQDLAVTATADGSIETFGQFSSGFIAQSIGGGGGNGGFAVSGGGSGAGTGSGALSASMGGFGSGGGDGKGVDATVDAWIWTHGDDSNGMLVQSIGGGGGNGGFNLAGSGSGAGTGSGSVTLGLGGFGGAAGDGGDVVARSTDFIYTDGDRSMAFIAQSIGGGGGNGGFNLSGGGSGAGTGSGSVSLGVGGFGVSGGSAGSVTASTAGTIFTMGENSGGILAQSVGGGGGNGGFTVNLTGSGAGTGSGSFAAGIGGAGSSGGSADTVNLTVNNNVTTLGENSSAVIAQSIGGGGGNGGFNVQMAGSGAGQGSGSATAGMGGMGAGGGNGEAVTNDMTGDVFTQGDNSIGLLVQSVGGGGGNGGFNLSLAGSGAGEGSGGAAIGVGGFGGGGGSSGAVSSVLVGDVDTFGDNATGVIAQSIGGGGGNGGFSVAGFVSGAKSGSGGASVSVGGFGAGGGASNTVNNSVTGNVVTRGTASGGVLAQSVGGGGGSGGVSVNGSVSIAGKGSGSAAIGVGGAGGGGGDGQGVVNSVSGEVYTSGTNAAGIVAQSIGGGGGNGGFNFSGTLSAAKEGSGAAAIGVGGMGGNGGKASTVDNTVTGFVQTLERDSIGILTQSVGGGGGNGGVNVSATVTASNKGSGGASIGVGGFGGQGGNADDVTSTITGGVVTTGNDSAAILTQSVGGGGGNGGTNVSASVNLSKENGGTAAIGLGGFGGAGGDAGNVTSTVSTTDTYTQIGTTGQNSSGVIAQSIGGGGGNGGTNVSAAVNIVGKNGAAIGLGVGGFGGTAGDAGDVDLSVDGLIITEGDNAHGFLAQSVGGGGGAGGVNVSAAVSITAGKSDGGGSGGSGGGGGGGNDNGGSSGPVGVSASIGVGGFGGGGGDAGDVVASFDGTIIAQPVELIPETTDPETGELIPEHFDYVEGSASHGLVAQSLGGGGGNGAVNVSAGVSYAAKDGDGHALLVGVGGFGGTGGSAGTVDVTVAGSESIASYGDGHSAILAQSAGGGGGNGGLNVSGGLVSDSPIVVGVGGLGANGGTADNVTVNATTNVTALSGEEDSTHSAGIMAQSLGGGGGNGGLNVSGGVSIKKENLPSITVGVGGFGGSGAVSGDVGVTHLGNAYVEGGWTHGIFAQSIAGGGGNGGLNVSGQFNWADSEDSGGNTDLSIVAGIGGHGGGGADAGNVRVEHNGAIRTKGDHSRGIFAQSVGGGGGTGGMNVTGVFTKNSSPVSVGIGGFGGGGGHAGDVTVIRGATDAPAALLSTDGQGAMGIEASSIGGGGGDAGMNFVIGITLASGGGEGGDDDGGGTGGSTRPHPKHTGVDDSVFTNYDKVLDELEGKTPPDSEDKPEEKKESAFAAQIAIGGDGGEAGNGGAVDVDNFGDILTLGDDSHGVLAQSIGGGGGNASYNVALTYATKGDDNKGFNFSLGGGTGDGGSGDTVNLEHEGIVETQGDNAYGLFAQSLGGGGGNVGFHYNKVNTKGGKLSINIGRQGGTGGYGGDVTVISRGSVITHGEHAYGILAQSAGNGGGNSSSHSFSGEIPGDEEKKEPARAASMVIGIEGGAGGDAGDVLVDLEGWVSTDGKLAHAVFAQSVGGGGGNAGDAKTSSSTLAIALGASGGTAGAGGTVDVSADAAIRTFGESALGILAQSVGGGGGTGSMTEASAQDISIAIGGSGGTGAVGSDVTVSSDGTIITYGDGSHAILAQSIGGGGGNAKATNAKIVDKKKEKKSDDGNGDSGSGSGGSGSGSGGSGSGTGTGTGEEEEQDKAVQMALAVGGSGGTGASAGSVIVTNDGGIGTDGAGAIGIFAQSIGGGGGNAEKTLSDVNSTEGATMRFSLGIGGAGGTGGTGGDVTVNNLENGEIITIGDGSHGILAMSVGGGGGNAASLTSKVTAKTTGQSSTGETFALGLGGSGGTGGVSGDVLVNNAGSITTYGEKAHGIIAQSIGGGGGNGSMVATGNIAASNAPTTNGSGSSGSGGSGSGGSGGSGSSMNNEGLSIGVGGIGGSGNTAGDVTVANSGAIEVFGDESYGILAQSIGGGGGNGGMAKKENKNVLTNPRGNIGANLMSIGIGGNGGDGGDSGDVLVDHTGSIVSHGDRSYGIYAQSVSGGGGKVGASATSPVWTAADLVVSTLIGGRGGADGEVGTVTINTVGDIVMLGEDSQAHFAQAVAGGGGDMELFLDVSQKGVEIGQDGLELPPNDGIPDPKAFVTGLLKMGAEWAKDQIASILDSNHDGDLQTEGDDSTGSVAQSIGGGGGISRNSIILNGEGTLNLEMELGGSQSENSGGGDVNLQRTGDVVTLGERSQGVSVQSIGGGGGRMLVDVQVVPVAPTPAPASARFANASPMTAKLIASPKAVVPVGADGSVSLGSDASVGDDGGDLNLSFIGDTVTLGDYSPGLVIQSIGAGGGEAHATGFDSLTVNLGGSGDSSGDGGNINLVNSGSIMAFGAVSDGIVIQSIGGGGGALFTDVDASSINLTTSSANSGDGGDISYTQTGDVMTSGDGSIAVAVQSIGGGGGLVNNVFYDTAGGSGTSGTVDLILDGGVVAAGVGGKAVFAQSRAIDGQGDITIELMQDKELYAGLGGTGVHISGGAANHFVNRGSISGEDLLLADNVIGEEGDETIENYNMSYGEFDLGAGVNRYTNRLGALLVAGPVLVAGGSDSHLINEGMMVSGDDIDGQMMSGYMQYAEHMTTQDYMPYVEYLDHAQGIQLSGNFTQTASGQTCAEMDFGDSVPHETGCEEIDHVNADGWIDLGGEEILTLLNPHHVPIGSYRQTLYHSDTAVIDNGMILTTAPSVVILYEMLYPTSYDAVVDYTVDFASEVDGGMSRNLREVGRYFNRIQQAGSSPEMADTVVKLLYDPDMETYRETLSQLSPDFYGEHQAAMIRATRSFNQALANDGGYQFFTDDWTIWLQYENEKHVHLEDGDYKKVNHYSDRFIVGLQRELSNDWIAGLGFSWEEIETTGYDGRWQADGDIWHIGGVVKRDFDKLRLSGTLSYSWSETDSQREGNVTEPFETDVTRDISALSTVLGAAYTYEDRGFYLQPSLDFGVTYIDMDSASETGAGATNLELKDYDETHFWTNPAVNSGKLFVFGSGLRAHFYGRLGLHYYLTEPETDVIASFEGAPDAASPMVIPIELEHGYVETSVGVDFISTKDFSVGVQYSTIMDSSYELDRFTFRASRPF